MTGSAMEVYVASNEDRKTQDHPFQAAQVFHSNIVSRVGTTAICKLHPCFLTTHVSLLILYFKSRTIVTTLTEYESIA